MVFNLNGNANDSELLERLIEDEMIEDFSSFKIKQIENLFKKLLTFTKICVIIITENKKGIDYMKKLYYGIVGKDVYEEWIVPENTVDVKVITKGDGIFLQYVMEDEKKKKWAFKIIDKNLRNLKHFYFNET